MPNNVATPWWSDAQIQALHTQWQQSKGVYACEVQFFDHVTKKQHTVVPIGGNVTHDLGRRPNSMGTIEIPAHPIGDLIPEWMQPFAVTATVKIGYGNDLIPVLSGPVTTVAYRRPANTATVTVCDVSHYLNWWSWGPHVSNTEQALFTRGKDKIKNTSGQMLQHMRDYTPGVNPYQTFSNDPWWKTWTPTFDFDHELPDIQNDKDRWMSGMTAADTLDYILNSHNLEWFGCPRTGNGEWDLGRIVVRTRTGPPDPDDPPPVNDISKWYDIVGTNGYYPNVALALNKNRITQYTVTQEQRYTHGRVDISGQKEVVTDTDPKTTESRQNWMEGNASLTSDRYGRANNGLIMVTGELEFGHVVYDLIDADNATARNRARKYARRLLARERRWNQTLQLETKPAPWLFPGHTITVTAAGSIPSYTVETVTLPLMPGPMTLQCTAQADNSGIG